EFLRRIDCSTPWIPNHPQLVVINLGVNDRRFPVAQFASAYDHFVSQVTTSFSGVPVVLLIPFSQHFKAEIKTIGQQHRLPVIETADWCPSYTDGLHPDQAGTTIAGQHLARAIASFLKQKGIE
ncbi:MAG: SGNH/GDSL hydrolase family protein, partial [Limosilactobacillus sp.]